MYRILAKRGLSLIQLLINPLLRLTLLSGALALVLGMTAAHSEQRSGESVVNEVCAACHKQGAKGAPKIGDKNAWAKRKTLGPTKLTQHALEGIRSMPAHGGNAGLNNIDLERAIVYMVNQSGGNWIEPVSKEVPRTLRTGEQVVKEKCGACHRTGKEGAPRIGDREAWVGRVSKGLDGVIASGIHGRGAMPARGGMADLTDAEMRAAVIYMFTESAAPKKKLE